MAWTVAKLLISAAVITLSSWLAGRKPALAGFILALPIASLLAMAFSYSEFQSWQKSITFARSILLAVPLSLLFFVPFLFADRLKWSFWSLYGSGLVLLALGYGVHRLVIRDA